MSLPKISIIIPSYNKAKFIGKTLESIVVQNYPNLEVIIQDGGSVDGTLDIIKRYAREHSKIFKWISEEDEGQLDAIKKGFSKATGEILTYINADDMYEEGSLLEVGKCFADNPKLLWLAGKGRAVNSKGTEVAKVITRYKNFLLKVNRYTFLLIVNYLFQPSVFISKEAYEAHGPLDGANGYVMEYDLWLKLGKFDMPKIVDRYLSKFTLTDDTISTTQYRPVLLQDYLIVKKYTKNPVFRLFHLLHNAGRVLIVKTINI